jgi:hypothetical protein
VVAIGGDTPPPLANLAGEFFCTGLFNSPLFGPRMAHSPIVGDIRMTYLEDRPKQASGATACGGNLSVAEV